MKKCLMIVCLVLFLMPSLLVAEDDTWEWEPDTKPLLLEVVNQDWSSFLVEYFNLVESENEGNAFDKRAYLKFGHHYGQYNLNIAFNLFNSPSIHNPDAKKLVYELLQEDFVRYANNHRNSACPYYGIVIWMFDWDENSEKSNFQRASYFRLESKVDGTIAGSINLTFASDVDYYQMMKVILDAIEKQGTCSL
jgi:hypothetical protein